MVVQGSVQGGGAPAADTALTDTAGFAHFTRLTFTRYALSVSRDFTDSELTRAGSALDNIDGLIGSSVLDLASAQPETVVVQARVVGGSSLVISEVFPTKPVLADGSSYYFDNYWEVYNNSDTVIALAGKLFIDGFPQYIELPGSRYNCQTFAAFQNDPAGLWANYTVRFPDDARPLGPGETAVIATDAVDHRQFSHSAGFFDLSRADYEFRGSADVDNPLAKNMVDVGPHRPAGLGHGLTAWTSRLVWALALELDVDTLPSHYDPVWGGGSTLVRIPNAALLDVVQWKTTSRSSLNPTECRSPVQPDLDAAPAIMLSNDDSLAMHRRVKRILPSGRVVLQRSRNSAADFTPAPGTPGRVP